MAEQRPDTFRGPQPEPQQVMSIHTRKITDACRDKDCIEDLRVFLTASSQELLDTQADVRVRSAELLDTCVEVEPVAFDQNRYCVQITFYYRILADGVVGVARPVTLYGLAAFSKRAVLWGQSSRCHIYHSGSQPGQSRGNLPSAVVEVLDPMVLGWKVLEESQCPPAESPAQVPQQIRSQFDEELVVAGEHRRLFVTLGQFSVIRLERETQLTVPVLAYATPCKQCSDSPGGGEDPCQVFSRIPFPAAEFAAEGETES